MDSNRRNFILSLIGVVGTVFTFASRSVQQQKDIQQDSNQASLKRDQAKFSKDLNELDIPDTAPLEAMDQVYLRLMCEALTGSTGVPIPHVKRYLEAARAYVLAGGDAFDPDFWNDMLEWLESVEPQQQGERSLDYLRLTAYCNEYNNFPNQTLKF